MDERAVPPSETPDRPRLARRSLQPGIVAALVALLPPALLARLTTARAQDSVRDEVTLRLRVTTNMSASLLAEQMAGPLRPGRDHPGAAGADGRPAGDRRHRPARPRRHPVDSPVAQELVGTDFSERNYYRGLRARGDTYVRAVGRPRAILLLSVRLDAVQPLADTVAAVQGVNLWVTDQRGGLLAAPGGRPPGLKAAAGEPIGRAAALPAGQAGDIDLGGQPSPVVHRRVDRSAGRCSRPCCSCPSTAWGPSRPTCRAPAWAWPCPGA